MPDSQQPISLAEKMTLEYLEQTRREERVAKHRESQLVSRIGRTKGETRRVAQVELTAVRKTMLACRKSIDKFMHDLNKMHNVQTRYGARPKAADDEANPEVAEIRALLKRDREKLVDREFKSEYVDRAIAYARGVVDGKVPAWEALRMTCAKFLEDLGRDDLPYFMSAYEADRVCRIIEKLPHVKGRWANNKELLKLGDWQCWLVVGLFGWLKKGSLLRRYREVYWEICRKNGKSVLAAAICIVMFCADEECGSEVYSGATTEKQAWEVFRPARLMLLKTPALLEAAGIEVHAKSITMPADASRFEPMIGKPGDGSSPSCSCHDEFHEHDTPDQVDTMQTGMLAREQPILMKITTAGYNLAGPCYEHRARAIKVMTGALDEPTLFAVVYTIDLPQKGETNKKVRGDQWDKPACLAKANPNLGVSVDREFLEAQQRQASINPSEQVKFMTKHLNMWCSARQAWVSLNVWNSLADAQLTEQELAGCRCIFAFDLASKIDIAAFVKIFTRNVHGMQHYYVFLRAYIPEDRLYADDNKNKQAYQNWHKRGLLTATHGATTDFERIKDDLIADAKRYNPAEIVYDPFNATHISQLLVTEGLTLVEFRQTPQNFAVPMDECEAAFKDGRLHHDGNDLMTWMVSNVKTAPARKGLWWPTKETNDQKIDGPVAMIMGVGRAMEEDPMSGLDGFLKGAVTA